MVMQMTKAYVLLVNEPGTDDSVMSYLSNVSSVVDAFGTFGTYDVLIKLESFDEQKIQNDISNGIRKIPHIRSTLTLLVDKSPGILKTTSLDESVLDSHSSQAFVAVHCYKSLENDILKNLNTIPEIISGDIIVGSYEILCRLVAPTYNDISDIVSTKIRKIPGIKSTLTINVINHKIFSKTTN